MAYPEMEDNKSTIPLFGKDADCYMLCNTLHHNLIQWMHEGFLCDFTIHVDGEDIQAHACVLASSCEFFKTLQATDLGGDKTRCTLPCGTAETIRNILDFIYSHDVSALNLNWENIDSYLLCADYLICSSLTACCFHFMCCELDGGNLQQLPQALLLYHQYSQNNGTISADIEDNSSTCYVTILKNIISQVIMAYPNALKESSVILELEESRLVAILKNDVFQHVNMKYITETIIKWYEHDPDGRINHFEFVFKNVVDINCLSLAYLQTISSCTVFKKAGLDQCISNMLTSHKKIKDSESIIFVHADSENSDHPFLCSKYTISQDRWDYCKSPRGFIRNRQSKQFQCDSVYAEGYMYTLWWEDPSSMGQSFDVSQIDATWPTRGVFKCYNIKGNQWYNLPDPFSTMHLVGPCKLIYAPSPRRIYALGVEGHFISFQINASGGSYHWQGCDGLPHRMTFDDFNYGYKKILLKATQLCYSQGSPAFIYAYVPEALKENEYDEENHHIDKSFLYAYLARYNTTSDRWDMLPSKMNSSGNITIVELKRLNSAHLEVLTNSHHYHPKVESGQFQIISYIGKPILRYNLDLSLSSCFWEVILWNELEENSTVKTSPLRFNPFSYEYYPIVVGNSVYLLDGPRRRCIINGVSSIWKQPVQYFKWKNRPKIPLCVKIDVNTMKWRQCSPPPGFCNIDCGSYCVVPMVKHK